MAPTVLVTGASGLLGRDVITAFQRVQYKAVGTALTRANPPNLVKLDLLDKQNLISVLDDVKPNVIIHCAANRFPDSCNDDPAAATALNVDSTRTLAQEALNRDAFLVYISTDYVFPGRKGEAPYRVTDKPNPPNIYGRTKYEGEQAVLSVTSASEAGKTPAVILRVPLLYGHVDEHDKSKSAVHPLVDAVWKAQKLKDGDSKIQVDDWALRFPTCTEDVARVIVDISKKYTDQNAGTLPSILQFSGQKRYTKYEMVKIFGEILDLPMENVEPHDPSKEEEVSGATQRPYDSHLDMSVLEGLGIEVSNQEFVAWWRRELRAVRR